MNISLAEFLTPLCAAAISSLSAIPAVQYWQSHTQHDEKRKRKNWLRVCATAFVLGVCMIVAGTQALLFGDKSYQYVSAGVVYPGESKEIFSNWRKIYQQQMEAATREKRSEIRQEMVSKGVEMIQRADEYYLVETAYRGDLFNISAKGGSRTFRLTGVKDTINSANQLLVLFGVLIFMTGLLGYFNDWRLHRQS